MGTRVRRRHPARTMRRHPAGGDRVAVALHIDIPTQAQIAALLDARAVASVSIYLPTSPLPQDAEAARIEFKNLGAEALRQLDGNAGVAEQPATWTTTTRSGST